LNISGRRFVVDEAMGAIVGFARFGPNQIPDTHLFRLVNGKIRYVHTLSVCPRNGCQFFRVAKQAFDRCTSITARGRAKPCTSCITFRIRSTHGAWSH
jgi:hypothetical protein